MRDVVYYFKSVLMGNISIINFIDCKSYGRFTVYLIKMVFGGVIKDAL